MYERQFSDRCFGFRTERNTHKALHRCRKYIAEGYRYAIDMDMEKFFDTVSHSKLIEILSRTIDDGRVIPPIHSYLNAGAVVDHGSEPAEQAVPQGGPLCPLLSNIMLNELDKEFTERGHRFVRYADDTVVLCRSRRGAGRVKQSITDFIEKRLFLKVNNDKPQAVFFNQIKFRGYSFCQVKGNIRFRIHQKSIVKLRDKIKLLTSRGNGWGCDYRKERLIDFIKGWLIISSMLTLKACCRGLMNATGEDCAWLSGSCGKGRGHVFASS